VAHLWHIRNLNPPVVVRAGPAPLTSAQVKRLRLPPGTVRGEGLWHICGTRPSLIDGTPPTVIGANSDELKPRHKGSLAGPERRSRGSGRSERARVFQNSQRPISGHVSNPSFPAGLQSSVEAVFSGGCPRRKSVSRCERMLSS
jgi:hypothetical protein